MSRPALAMDQRGRGLRDLRVSVTDRCNLRCAYCMPRSSFAPGHRFLGSGALLSPAEIETVVRAFMRTGVRRVRLTGGEPLLRRELCDIIRRVATLGLDDLALTTNGLLLRRQAHHLRRAGLHRLTVSLDTLNPQTFARVSEVRAPLAQVLDGIAAAEDAGFRPLKLNCVVRRGVNDGELLQLAAFARDRGHTLRLIEYMDVGASNGWNLAEVVRGAEIVERVGEWFPLEPIAATHRGEVARRYRYLDGRGELGVITSISEPFCADCTRARVSADGRVFTCLFAAHGIDLAAPLRAGADDVQLGARIAELWGRRDDRYSELRAGLGTPAASSARVEMSYIGG